jgi:hypothetical protein
MRLLSSAGFGLLVVATACSVGTHARNYAPANGPAGAVVSLQLTDKSRGTGELLAVETSALLLLRDSQLVRVPLSRVRRGSAPKLSFDGSLRDNTRERLRLISRYPQGVSSELEGRLLRAYGQSEVGTLP